MRSFTSNLAALLVLFVSIAACSNQDKVPAPETLGQVSDEEAHELGVKISAALATCDRREISEVLDLKAPLQRGLRTSNFNGYLQQRMLSPLLLNTRSYAKQFCADEASETTPKLLGIRERDQRKAALIRIENSSGIYYLEFLLGRSVESTRTLRADDVFSHGDGMLLSERMREGFNASEADVGGVEKAKQFVQLAASNPAQALVHFSELSNVYQTSKPHLLHALSAAGAVGLLEYEKLLAVFVALYPDHPPLDLLMLDPAWNAMDFEKVQAAIDSLEKIVGNDDYLDRYRVGAIIAEGKDLSRAVVISQKLINQSPDEEVGYTTMLDVLLALQDHEAAAGMMRTLGEKFDYLYEAEDVEESEIWKHFAASESWPKYQAWTDENFVTTEESDLAADSATDSATAAAEQDSVPTNVESDSN